MHTLMRWLAPALMALQPVLLTAAGFVQLGDAPPAPSPEQVEALRQMLPPFHIQGAPYTVNTASREEVRSFFNTVHAASEGAVMNWTGNHTNCDSGTTAAGFRDAVVRRINFFRAMAGVPAGIVLNDIFNAKDQDAALMMSANNQLSHTPTNTWRCYSTDGTNAAANSNLALGSAGPDAITGYMFDHGANNAPVGHRRWLLYPQTQTMGTGDVEAAGANATANATWVFDGNYGEPRPATRTNFVSWPPPGFVPYLIVYPRWSFSYPLADLSSASVTLSSSGTNVPVRLEPVATGRGENTLVWVPDNLDANDYAFAWPRPAADKTYSVTVQNARIGGSPTTFTYAVIVFDPEVPGPDSVLPVINGPAQPAVGQNNAYTFSPVPNDTGYQWRSSLPVPFSAVEGAENGLADFASNTSPGYAVVVSSPRVSDSFAFHLAQPAPPRAQTLTYTRVLLPGANAQIRFSSRLGWATVTQAARVQASLDQGSSWLDLYTQAGTDGRGEQSFTTRTASLSPFAGRSLLVRFNYEYTGGSYYYSTDSGVGWHFDDISFTDTEELTDRAITDVPHGTNFTFAPAQAGDYALDVRAEVYDEFHLEWGSVKRVSAITAVPPVLTFIGNPTFASNQVQIEFVVTNYRAGLTFRLHRAAELAGPWAPDNAATFQEIVAGSRFRATALLNGASQEFYRGSAQ
jgi:uncharacterized protein YkwD